MESIKLYKKSAKWLFDNLEYFDPRNESKIADNKYKIKAFMELLFVQNMFYHKNYFLVASNILLIILLLI